MLLRCYLIHITIIYFIFYVQYICVHVQAQFHLCCIYVIQFSFSASLKQTHLFLCIFQNVSHYFWMIAWMKKVNNFQEAKFQPQGVPQLLLNVCHVQPGIAYKSVAYKKKLVAGWHLLERDIISDFVLASVDLAMILH